MAADDQDSQPPQGSENGIDEREIRQESARAAQKARQAQRKAYELRQAANGAGDPEERQKLLEQAIDKEVEAESFGKWAKYMRRGSFQGMAVGAGIGVVPGLTLGTLTGTIVGGLVSTITGGLGAAGGAIVGAFHGPFWNVGEVAGKGIQKITGNLPGWKATDEQKWYLENMLGQARQEEMPTAHELEFLRHDDGSKDWGSYVEGASSWIPSWMKSDDKQTGKRQQHQRLQRPPQQRQSQQTTLSSADRSEQRELHPDRSAARTANQKAGDDLSRHLAAQQAAPSSQPSNAKTQPMPPAGKAVQGVDQMQTSAASAPQPMERKKPRKLETRSTSQPQTSTQQTTTTLGKRQPRKLERRT